eukprot:211526_1
MLTTFPLDKVKYMDQKVVNLVFGYLRNAESILPQNNNYYNIASIIKHFCLLYYRDAMNSEILTTIEQKTFFDLLYEHNKFGFNEYGYLLWKLIYRGSKDGFSYDSFVKHCFNKKDIVCIIQTTNNNCFGGYTCVGYQGDGLNEDTKFIKDKKAFMFLVKSSFNYPPIIAPIKFGYERFAIATCKPYYCIFGSGWDCYCSAEKYGNTYIASYKFPTVGKYLNGPKTGHFYIKEIEVFQLK